MKALMIAAMQSRSGKTVFSCALMAALRRRGLQVCAFKSGPDYIDPMFHRRVLGIESRNLDLFLQGKAGVQHSFARAEGDVALVEAAMGYYDGINMETRASAWELARVLEFPVLLVLRPKGSCITLAAQVRGMLEFRAENRIAGLLLNDCSEALAQKLRPVLERECGLPVLGCLPPMPEAGFESRHLGLMTADEIGDFDARMKRLAEQTEQSVDLDRMLSLAEEKPVGTEKTEEKPRVRCRIAVAEDEAFCFRYADSLRALGAAGAELVYFSPLHDRKLPEADGLYLCGGYPELYAEPLSENSRMREDIRQVVADGLPTVAECGGFLYLQESLEGTDGKTYPMCGALPGKGYRTGTLRRFGYLTLEAKEDSLLFRAGETIPAHEFHYWDSTDCGRGLTARKEDGRQWQCGVVGAGRYAAFPHLHFGGELPLAERFVKACEKYADIN